MLLYIHIPFCTIKCPYCAFGSFVGKLKHQQDYTNALIKQFEYEIEKFNIPKKSIESVFIGGGTPSLMEIQYMEKIFRIITPYLKDDIEITIEANPNTADETWLRDIKKLGVNRVSFGVQSFDKNKLKFLGRDHSAQDAITSISLAHKVGFKNISLDIIYECSLDSISLLKQDLNTALNLPINHISAYSLTIEPNTPFFAVPHKRKSNLELAEFVIDTITSHGFKQYEISNFGSYQSTHNLGYWKYKNYLGIGVSAVGCMDGTRYYANKKLNEYIQNPTFMIEERLSQKDIILEKIFLGMRSIVGVEQKILNKSQIKKANMLVKEGKLEFRDNKYFNKDFLLADEIALYLES